MNTSPSWGSHFCKIKYLVTKYSTSLQVWLPFTGSQYIIESTFRYFCFVFKSWNGWLTSRSSSTSTHLPSASGLQTRCDGRFSRASERIEPFLLPVLPSGMTFRLNVSQAPLCPFLKLIERQLFFLWLSTKHKTDAVLLFCGVSGVFLRIINWCFNWRSLQSEEITSSHRW